MSENSPYYIIFGLLYNHIFTCNCLRTWECCVLNCDTFLFVLTSEGENSTQFCKQEGTQNMWPEEQQTREKSKAILWVSGS